MRVWVGLLVLAALAATAVASTADMHMELENSAYQWAELSDSAVAFSSSVGSGGIADASDAEVEQPNFNREVMELRASINIDAIIEGRQNDDAELDAALLEMEISSSLSSEASPADFYRFARTHSRLYANEKAAGAAFAAFKLNKRSAAHLNAELGITSESEAVFSANGPLAAMNPTVFKNNILTSKNPRGRSKGVKVRFSKVNPSNDNSANSKSRSLKSNTGLQPLANSIGQAIGAGHAAGKSGKVGGQSGKTGGKSGKSGGKSGKSGGKSGKTGGDGGSTAKKSGKTGGGNQTGGGRSVYSTTNGTIALPGAQQNAPYKGFTDPKFAAQQKLTAVSLREQSLRRGRISSSSYDFAYSILKSQKARLIDRASQFNSKGEYFSVLPTQINECGSCWAIAAQQSLQRYWTAASFKGVLSIQQLLDCARTVDSKGCKGGAPMDAFEYWAQNLAASEVDYPTVMRDQTCKKPPFPNSFKGYPSGGWEMLLPECKDGDKNCDDQIQYEWLALSFIQNTNFQPPIAYVDGSMWQNYRGGIFPPSMCKSTMEAGNHVVQIVGAGVDNLGLPYWLLDNFWGSQWGESGGKIRVPFGVNACGLFNFVIYATAPPFDQGKPVGWIPPYNSPPVPYTPKPLALKRAFESAGAIGKQQSDLKNFAQFINPLGQPSFDKIKEIGKDTQSAVGQAAAGGNKVAPPNTTVKK